MPRKITIFMSAGMAGTDTAEAYIVPDDVSDDELCSFAWELAIQHAASYGIEQPPDECEEDDNEDSYSPYWNSVEGYWKPYSSKHDGVLIRGDAKEVYWNEY